MLGVPGWISMASGAMASGALMYSGSSSRSNLTLSAAARAWASLSAQTMARASPYWNTLVSLRMGRSQPSPLLSAKVMRPVMRFLPLTSLWVSTRTTPGIFSASEVSMPLMMAWETLAWARARCRVSGGMCTAASAPYSARPVTLTRALGRGRREPKARPSAGSL